MTILSLRSEQELKEPSKKERLKYQSLLYTVLRSFIFKKTPPLYWSAALQSEQYIPDVKRDLQPSNYIR